MSWSQKSTASVDNRVFATPRVCWLRAPRGDSNAKPQSTFNALLDCWCIRVKLAYEFQTYLISKTCVLTNSTAQRRNSVRQKQKLVNYGLSIQTRENNALSRKHCIDMILNLMKAKDWTVHVQGCSEQHNEGNIMFDQSWFSVERRFNFLNTENVYGSVLIDEHETHDECRPMQFEFRCQIHLPSITWLPWFG